MAWHPPSAIVASAFKTHDVVIINEGHNGFSRCVRTRRVGLSVLSAAHEHGCRHLAMEALANPTDGPKHSQVAPTPSGYLSQPEMMDLVEAALVLGWTLIAYEAAPDKDVARSDGVETIQHVNRRELGQATNLVRAKRNIGPGAKMLVWCGNGHHAKRPVGEWRPMGFEFTRLFGEEPYCIDQLPTVALAAEHRAQIELTEELASILSEHGGTAGFHRIDPPNGYWVPEHYDSLILSTDNVMTEMPF
jgi:hypothetical protein